MRPTVLTGFPLYKKTIMSSILGCDGRLLLLSAFARNVRLTKNVDLSAISVKTCNILKGREPRSVKTCNIEPRPVIGSEKPLLRA
jgi:hypothetical protein